MRRFIIHNQRIFFFMLFLLSCNSISNAQNFHWQRPNYIINSFIEIALNNEYSKRLSTVRKWQQPIRYQIEHRTGDQSLHQQLVKIHLGHLQSITNISISPVTDADLANLTIIFSSEKKLVAELQNDLLLNNQSQIEYLSKNSVCLAHFSLAKDNSINTAIVIIPVDRARAHGKLLSCIVEELTQIMGLPNDSEKVFPSIFNDKSHDDYLSGLDFLLLKLLYHRKIRSGMTKEQALAMASEIVKEEQYQKHIVNAERSITQKGIYSLLN